MHFLIMFPDDERPFSFQQVHSFVESHPGFSNLRFSEPGGAVLEAEFTLGSDSMILRLSGDLNSVSLSDESASALSLAFALQKSFSRPLRLIDCNYTFDLNLKEYDGVDEIWNAIKSAHSR
jgi:hypothetical protein